MSVKIVQSEFIQQRFLNDFMGKQKWFDAHPSREPSKAAGQVAVDEDGTSVAAITRDVRDVVVAIDDADAVSDGAHASSSTSSSISSDVCRKLSVKIQAGNHSRCQRPDQKVRGPAFTSPSSRAPDSGHVTLALDCGRSSPSSDLERM
jgi:hypothetical protein